MGKVARNALKGYTFQHYIFTLFQAKYVPGYIEDWRE